MVEFVRGRDNSTLNGQCEYFSSGFGLEYVLKGKSTIELFKINDENETIIGLESRIDSLTKMAKK